MCNTLSVFIKTGASFWFCLLSLEREKKKSKNRTEKPPGTRGCTRLVPAFSYILGRGAGNLTLFQCCSMHSKAKHPRKHPQLSPLSLRVTPGEGAEWGRAWQGWEGHSYLPTDRSSHFPPARRPLLGWGEGREAPQTLQSCSATVGSCILSGPTGDAFGSCQSRCCTPGWGAKGRHGHSQP